MEQFKEEVLAGLSSSPKTLPSKYFYDELGDQLFVEIMHMPEYYLTRAELEIFQQKAQDLIQAFNLPQEEPFELVELGAGDGMKTKELLLYLQEAAYAFDYVPIDISAHALSDLEQTLNVEFPDLPVRPRQGEYFEVLASFRGSERRKVVLFLGSNLGNLTDDEAHAFLQKLGSNLNKGDLLLLGVDLIKPEEVVLPAYNDKSGITARFNLNLLTRINRELKADFELEHFKHDPHYDEQQGIAFSYLTSTQDQRIRIEALNRTFDFKKGEKIHTEISRKYDDKTLSKILRDTAFEVEDKVMDSQGYFADYVLRRV